LNSSYYIHGINGPVVYVKGGKGLSVSEMVFAGDLRLIGEVVGVDSDYTVVQIYGETSGLRAGEPVTATGAPISIDLGPSLLGSIFDGIARPLRKIRVMSGDFIARGIDIPSVDTGKNGTCPSSSKQATGSRAVLYSPKHRRLP
jgi:V/A-type H+-transporting ATPase subunit A